MKLVQQTKLYFKEGNSDKAYEIDLCEVGSGQYLVNFRFGKRGATLKDGTKTPAPVALPEAQRLYNELEAEKRKKGYQSEQEALQPLPTLVFDTSAPRTPEVVILQRLQAAAEGKPDGFKTTWKLSRVLWAAGQLRLQAAVPFVIKLVDRGDEMQRYAALWALGRIGDPAAARTLGVYFANQKYTDKTRRIAGEGLLHTLAGDERQAHLDYYFTRLPDAFKADIQVQHAASLETHLRERALGQTHPNYDYLEHLYALSLAHPFVRKPLLATLRAVKLRPSYFRHVRHLYKLAELRDDYELLGLLAYRFEQSPAMYSQPKKGYYDDDEDWASKRKSWVTELNESIRIKPEIKKPDSRVAYSDRTRGHFQRRAARQLHALGAGGQMAYVKLATATLLSYDKATDYQAAFVRNDYDYRNMDGQPNSSDWVQVEIFYPAYASARLLNQILYGNGTRLKLGKNGQWQSTQERIIQYYSRQQGRYITPEQPTSFESQQQSGIFSGLLNRLGNLFGGEKKVNQPTASPAVGAASPAREEPYPELWDQLPQAYVQLLMQGKVDEVHAFALNNLQNHPDYAAIVGKFTLPVLEGLLQSAFPIPALFGLDVARQRLAQATDPALVLALLGSSIAEARALGMEYAAKDRATYLSDTERLAQWLFSPHADLRDWTQQQLAQLTLTPDQLNALLARLVAAMVTFKITSDESAEEGGLRLASVASFLTRQYENALRQLSGAVIQDLLAAPLPQAQVFGVYLLGLKPADQLSPALLLAILTSPFQPVRQAGASLLDTLRETLQQTPALGTHLASALVPLLSRKEPSDDFHADVATVLTHQLVEFLSFVSLETTLNLVYANYRPAQDLGLRLLTQYVRPEDLTVRQVIATGNHELLAFRQWCWAFFTTHAARMRYEHEESIRLLDAKWDDTRAFAKDYFRTQFTAEDWTPDVLVAVIDTVRPDVQAFGRELITKFFDENHGEVYLLKLSQHPDAAVQTFATNYLTRYAADNPARLSELEHYFRAVLTRVNKARVAKDRVYDFLAAEAAKSEAAAALVASILADVSATVAIGDKARCIQLMVKLSKQYESLTFPIRAVAVVERG